MISEVFITTLDGQLITQKKYRSDIKCAASDVFGQHIRKHSPGSMAPYWSAEGAHFFHVRRPGLYLVAATCAEMMPVFVIELLTRLFHVLKDFCGVVSESSLRANLVLVSEILGEFIDHGYINLTSTEKLKPYIQSEPVPTRAELSTDPSLATALFGTTTRTIPSSAADRPVIQSRQDKEVRKNEIFIDVIEKMTVTISSDERRVRSEVSGVVNMKSFLAGCPEIKLGVNEDLAVPPHSAGVSYGSNSRLDEYTFHQCVNSADFEKKRILAVRPPQGEVGVMTYCLRGDLPLGLPFTLHSNVDTSQRDLELHLRLCCNIPTSTHALNIHLKLPVPRNVTSISQQLSGAEQKAEFIADKNLLNWNIRKLYGKSEVTAKFKLIVNSGSQANRNELGPASLDFEISGFVCSNLQIQFLRVFDAEHSYVPQRWVRYVTVPDSYIIKL